MFSGVNWRPQAPTLRIWKVETVGQAPRRLAMNPNRRPSLTALTTVTLIIRATLPSHVVAASSRSDPMQWSVQVDKVVPGDVNIAPAFKIAIYENLLQELTKGKEFKQVLRSGDRNADGVPNVLILKTKVESYTEGSE